MPKPRTSPPKNPDADFRVWGIEFRRRGEKDFRVHEGKAPDPGGCLRGTSGPACFTHSGATAFAARMRGPGFEVRVVRLTRGVAEFLASRHVEQRSEVAEARLVRPAGRPGETLDLTILSETTSCWLFRVDDPPGYGWRLVAWADDARSASRVWEMPGYSAREAHVMAGAVGCCLG